MMKKVVKREVIGVQPVFSTNVVDLGNYITEGDVINKNCVVDENYQGECHLNLTNTGDCNITIEAGDKIVQGLVLPINYCQTEEMSSLEELYKDSTSDRGSDGFGSSGTK